MARPQKIRRICSLPHSVRFGPLDQSTGRDQHVALTVDEYECIRLIDLLGCSQEECAIRMQVARSTVQAVYNSARQKLAEFLVYGCSLEITGGCYCLCDRNDCCGRTCTRRQCRNRRCEGGKPGAAECHRPCTDPPKDPDKGE